MRRNRSKVYAHSLRGGRLTFLYNVYTWRINTQSMQIYNMKNIKKNSFTKTFRVRGRIYSSHAYTLMLSDVKAPRTCADHQNNPLFVAKMSLHADYIFFIYIKCVRINDAQHTHARSMKNIYKSQSSRAHVKCILNEISTHYNIAYMLRIRFVGCIHFKFHSTLVRRTSRACTRNTSFISARASTFSDDEPKKADAQVN